MRVVDIIEKKRDGKKLSNEEIDFLLDGYQKGEVPDYQVSSFCMAIFFKGMEQDELVHFTRKMVESGDEIKFKNIKKYLVDKHSTGGVGDKTSISLAPIYAAFDMGTAKLSGRGLGHTGGTIDKLEAIANFKFAENVEDMEALVNNTGIGLMGAAGNIVPLDKKIYALRDVTGTVPSIELIASSVISKKLAVHADAIVLDVKVGNGAFMKTLEDARLLADRMLDIGKGFQRNIVCILTDMDQPLGKAVGNSLEVIEAIEMLRGNGPKDYTELVEVLAAEALILRGDTKNKDEAIKMVQDMVASGRPLENLRMYIKACGGDPLIVDDYKLLPTAKNIFEVKAERSGSVARIMAEDIGKAAMVLGAGRATKDDVIDHAVGLILEMKVGQVINEGDVIATVHYNSDSQLETSIKMIHESIEWSDQNIDERNVILEIKR
ncbi:MAG: thymidine phosphorylase [Bacteriovoracaceae bacterium]|nr:thymidine phosphorylase [Bacteriovoracaceae bacterium]